MKSDPNKMLDTLIQDLNLKNDAALSRYLEVAAPVVSKIRHGKLPVGDSMLLRIHDRTGIRVNHLRMLMGVESVALKAAP